MNRRHVYRLLLVLKLGTTGRHLRPCHVHIYGAITGRRRHIPNTRRHHTLNGNGTPRGTHQRANRLTPNRPPITRRVKSKYTNFMGNTPANGRVCTDAIRNDRTLLVTLSRRHEISSFRYHVGTGTYARRATRRPNTRDTIRHYPETTTRAITSGRGLIAAAIPNSLCHISTRPSLYYMLNMARERAVRKLFIGNRRAFTTMTNRLTYLRQTPTNLTSPNLRRQAKRSQYQVIADSLRTRAIGFIWGRESVFKVGFTLTRRPPRLSNYFNIGTLHLVGLGNRVKRRIKSKMGLIHHRRTRVTFFQVQERPPFTIGTISLLPRLPRVITSTNRNKNNGSRPRRRTLTRETLQNGVHAIFGGNDTPVTPNNERRGR